MKPIKPMKTIKPMKNTALTLVTTATILGSVVHSSAAIAIYDWSTATGSASPGTTLNSNTGGNISGANDGWAYSSKADDFNVISNNQPVGFSGNYVSVGGDTDSNASRLNDGSFGYTIAPGATEVTLSLVLHLDGNSNSWGWAGLRDLENGSGEDSFRIGFKAFNGWGYRGNDAVEVYEGDTGVSIYDATPTSYRATAVFNLVSNTYSYTVENLTSGGSVVLASNVAIATAVADLDWSTYDGLFMRGRNVSFDGISVASVPEPSSTALLGLGGLALILRRRK